MLQAYSSNLTVAANTACPLNNVFVDKGCAERLSGPATIQLNKCGVYLVECDGYCSPVEAGDVTLQLYRDGVAQPQAITSFTGAVDTLDTFGFKTFVQVRENNSSCCCSSPTTLQVMNGETEIENAHINVCVTKIC